MNKSFSEALSAALKPAEEIQKLFAQVNGENELIEDAEINLKLAFLAMKAEMGLIESINALMSLKKQIESGVRLSGLRCSTISEKLFEEACRSGDLKLSVYAMTDSVAIPVIEAIQKVFGILLVYVGDIGKAAARLHGNKEASEDNQIFSESELTPSTAAAQPGAQT